MEKHGTLHVEEKFSSPEDELKYLREQIARKEKQLESKNVTFERHDVVSEELKAYKTPDKEQLLTDEYKMSPGLAEAIVLDLSPEPHDKKIEELIGILYEKGVYNTLAIIEEMNNPHLEDDFHRFLIEYVKKGFPVQGLKEKTPLSKSLHQTLFEIALPQSNKEEKEKALKEMLSSMEQFYAGMLSVGGENGESFTLEVAVSNGSNEFIFYASVPDSKINLFEKQILSIFEGARITEKKDDYNIFNSDGASIGSYATYDKNPIYPIKTYEQFDYDPLNIILNTFSKLSESGEGAAIQITFNPRGDYYVKRYRDALGEINKGTSLKKAIDIRHTFFGQLRKEAKEMGKDLLKNDAKKDKEKEQKPIDQTAVEQITHKIETPIIESNIRILSSAADSKRATEIISDIEAAFNQFENTLGNKLTFKRCDKSKLKNLVREFSFRMFDKGSALPMNLRELTTLFHFPGQSISGQAQLKQSKAGEAPAPLDLPREGVLLGINKFRNVETPIYITPEDRLRHYYTIGQTGTGKTTLLKNMIIQDIKNGDGVCMIDPHGSDIQDVLANIPPERYEDVIYFDPSYTERPMAFNMLEYDPKYPEQKTFVVNEMMSIFNKLFDMKTAGGPMFEQYFRNATMLVIEDPETGNTLLDVSRVLANKTFRDMKIARCKNPIVVQFWKEVAEKAGGESSLANIVPYITSKFDVFLSNDIMRPIIAQEHSSFNFREIMDNKKILLVNLSKGRLGDINANLLGLIIVGKILMAALSRVDSLGSRDLAPFYLYIDEFQNITTDSIATILSEARKYKLGLIIAHQFIAQLEEKIKDAVFGNVGTITAFRVGAEDAEYLESQFAPVFTKNDLMNVDNHHAYLKMLAEGRPVRPFSIEKKDFPPKGNPDLVPKLKELSYLKFGKDRATVEEAIMEKYRASSTLKQPII